MSEQYSIAPRFRRSVRLDTDFASATAIDGFHCPASFQAAVKFMASHVAETEQGAFTWTGPYGGGKSSLAVAFACLFGAPKSVRDEAASLFGDDVVSALKSALPYFPGRWTVLPLVTERRSISAQLAELIGVSPSASPSEILKAIEEITKNRGLLLIMDELGRGLEAAADGDGDLHLLQDIAELASRSQGRLIFIGVLHQAFEEYAERLGRKARDSWAKIQGRFVDISISVSLEETVELVGEALGHERAVRRAIPLAEDCVAQLRPTRKKTEAKRMAGKLAENGPASPIYGMLDRTALAAAFWSKSTQCFLILKFQLSPSVFRMYSQERPLTVSTRRIFCGTTCKLISKPQSSHLRMGVVGLWPMMSLNAASRAVPMILSKLC